MPVPGLWAVMRVRADQAVAYRDELIDLTALAQRDLRRVVALAEEHPDEAMRVIMDVYPQVLEGYRGTAEDFGRVVLADHAPGVRPVSPGAVPEEVVRANSAYALFGAGDTFTVLSGSMQRHIFDAARFLVSDSIDQCRDRRVTWARHASATACGFCRMLATRGDVYHSEAAATSVVGRGKAMSDMDAMWRGGAGGPVKGLGGRWLAGGVKARGSRGLGSKYHDHCRCVAVPSMDYEPPSYVDQWREAYYELAKEADREGLRAGRKLNYIQYRLGNVS